MRVNVFDFSGEQIKTHARAICLSECIPDDDERASAMAAIEAVDEFWTGGGAAPLFRIVRCRSAQS